MPTYILRNKDIAQRMVEEETWKTAYEWPEYECSSFGRIRRVTQAFGTEPGRILKAPVAKNGYRVVRLSREGSAKSIALHRLIVETFVGKIPNGMCVCHTDGDKLNNCVENLRIDTYSGNSKDQILHGSTNRGDKCPNSKITPEIVRKIRERISAGERQKDVASDYGISPTSIYHIINGSNWGWVK